jgi:tetratricopeptide (TPR) repeat protein
LPEDSAVHYNLGRALGKAGRPEEAASELKLAQQQNDRARDTIRAKALNNEGNKLLESGQVQEALGRLREAVTLDPDDPISQYNYGVALLLANNADQAIEHFRATLRLKAEQPNAYYYLGRALMLKMAWPAAADALRQAVRLNPSDDAARKALAEAEGHTGR